MITVPSGAGIDNAKATIRIECRAVSDYDMKVYRADASGNATGEPLAVSGNGATGGPARSVGRRSCWATRPAPTWRA